MRLGLVVLFAFVCGCSVPVAANLDESDANQAILLLEKSGVGADKESDPEHEGRYRVSVSRGEASAAIGVLAQENMPGRSSPGVLEALGGGGIVPSRLAEHVKWTAGVAGDLERSLRSVDGVLSAHVHLAVPPKELLPGTSETAKPTASVLVRHRGATPPLTASDVQQLVAGAVAGLLPAHVNVVLATSPPTRAADRELLRFGPVTVTRGSALSLRLAVIGVVLLNVLLVSAVVLLFRRLKRTEVALDEAKAFAEPSPGRR